MKLKLFPFPRQAGMTLLEILAATAIASVLSLILAEIFVSVARSNIQAQILYESQSLIHYVQNILSKSTLCSNALRSTSAPFPNATKVVWDPVGVPGSQANVGYIQVDNNINPPSLAVATGGSLSPNFQVSRIYLREPSPALAEGTPAHSRIFDKTTGLNYDVISAKVAFNWTVKSQNVFPGNVLPERTVDVVLAINPVTHTVDFCPQNQTTQATNTVCSAATLYPGNLDCPAAPRSAGCVNTYYLQGFDTGGAPMCACMITCPSVPLGPTGQGGGGKGGGN